MHRTLAEGLFAYADIWVGLAAWFGALDRSMFHFYGDRPERTERLHYSGVV
jgi:hypothetical protein